MAGAYICSYFCIDLIFVSFCLTVFALLGLSVGTGLYQLATSPWTEKKDKNDTLQNDQEMKSLTK